MKETMERGKKNNVDGGEGARREMEKGEIRRGFGVRENGQKGGGEEERGVK